MSTYSINLNPETNVLSIGFAQPAQNDRIVKDADTQMTALIQAGQIQGGEVIRINGPASLPVAMVLAHHLSHRYQAVAVYDPKLSKYIVSIAHGSKYTIGDMLD